MIVDQVICAVDDLFGDEEGSSLRLRSIGFAGIETVHAFVIHWIDVRDFLFERSDVDQGKQDNRAGNRGGVEIGDQLFDSNDGSVLRAVGAGYQSEDGSGFGAIHDDHGNIRSGIDAGGDFEVTGRFLAWSGGG